MFTATFQRPREMQQLVCVKSVDRLDRNELWFAFSKCACLIHDERVHFLHQLECFSIFEKHAERRTLAGGHHDGHGRGQPQRTRAGDDQHCDSVDDGVGHPRIWSPEAPDDKGQNCNAHYDGHEVARNDVRKPLDRRAAPLCFAYHPHDLRQQRFRAHSLRAHDQRTCAVYGRPGQSRAGLLFYRDGLTGNHGFIYAARALEHDTIDGYLLPGTHAEPVARLDLLELYVNFCPVFSNQARRFRCQTQQRSYGSAGLASRTQFHHLSQKHQRGDHCGGFKVHCDFPAFAAERLGEDAGKHRCHHAVGIGNPDA